MEKIVLLDTAVGSTNKGDEIIMECTKEELGDLLKKYFVLSTPTHLSAFTTAQNWFSLPDSAREISESKYKFVCGTNLFSTNMRHRCCQWNINYFNSKPIHGSVFVGVGSNGKQKLDFYTKKLYKKVLSNDLIHSVREENAKNLLESMGLKCLNTGCVTLWKLTEEYCNLIPKEKADNVIFTLTDYKRDEKYDSELIKILRQNYKKIYFWVQGIYDLDYLKILTDLNGIEIIPPDINSYKEILKQNNLDYVGTRLHAGIFAMRCKKRAIIIAVDERMNAMRESINSNVILRKDIDQLSEFINSSIQIKININFDSVNKWKSQFK